MRGINMITLVLLIIGGLNWLLVGLFDVDLVAALFGEMSPLSRIVYVLVGLSAIAFAEASTFVNAAFVRLLASSAYWPLLVTPLAFAALSWSTRGVLAATRGSGIPQVIAALRVDDAGFRAGLLSLPVAAGKMMLTLVAIGAGASVGREGPSVHVGAAILYRLGQRFGFADPQAATRFILAGGAAGQLRGGRYLRVRGRHNRLLVTALWAMGLTDVESFGALDDDRGPLSGALV